MESRLCLKLHREAVIVRKPSSFVALLIFSYACLCLVPSVMLAQGERSTQKFYFSTDLGVAWQQDLTVKEKVFGFPTREKIQFDLGARFDLAVGYHFTDSFAAEFESGLIYKYTGTLEHTFDSLSTTLSGNQIHSLLFLFSIRF